MLSRFEKLGIFGILTLSVLAHLLYLGQPFFMDEVPILSSHMLFASERTIIPDFAKYPSLYIYVTFPATVVTLGIEHVVNGTGSIAQTAARLYLLDKDALVLGARVMSVLFVLGSSVAAFGFLRQQFSQKISILAALLIPASVGFLEYGSYALPESLLLLISFLTALQLVKFHQSFALRNLFWASVWAGFAMSVKYSAAPLVLSVIVLGIWEHARRREFLSGKFGRAFALCAAATLIAFLVGSPGWVLDFPFFLSELRWEIDHASEGHFGTSGVPILGHLELLFTYTPVIFVLTILGVILSFPQRDERSFPFAVFLACGFLVVAGSEKQSFQYLFALFPGLVGFAALALERLISTKTELGRIAIIGLGCLALWSFFDATRYLRQNTTDLAEIWIEENIPAGSKVAAAWAYVPELMSSEALAQKRGSDAYQHLGTDPLRSSTLYDVVSIPASISELDQSEIEYVLTSDQVFRRFFNFGYFTKQKPPENAAHTGEWQQTREFYRGLFEAENWRVLQKFETGNGPITYIFGRTSES